MKFATTLLPLAALATAFVIPDEELTLQMLGETKQESRTFFSKLSHKTSDFVDQVQDAISSVSQNAFDAAVNAAQSVEDKVVSHNEMTAFDGESWMDSSADLINNIGSAIMGHGGHHGGHHGHHGKHGKHGHCDKPNRTVYELINESKYTTKLASFINEFDDLVEVLNGTAANYTIFAPTDKAFESVMKHHPKPDKETLKMILAYHVSADFYPAGRVLVSHTIPTTFGEPKLGGNRQRLRVGLGLKGLAVNFYARIIAIDIFGTNGVIHGIDHVLFKPVKVAKVLQLLPADFSTLTLGLQKTGLLKMMEENEKHAGTVFAPSNWAFKKLGPKINMYLFSEHGKTHLEALLKYHLVPDHVLYSDAYYDVEENDEDKDNVDDQGFKHIPKGKFQIDLPTALEDKKITVDIARFGGFINMRLNGYNDVSTQDGIAEDGVVHKLDSVLIPPKMPGGQVEEATEELTVEELIARLDNWKVDL